MSEQFRECPYFSEGPDRCCGALHQQACQQERERSYTLIISGETKIISLFTLGDTIKGESPYRQTAWVTPLYISNDIVRLTSDTKEGRDNFFTLRHRSEVWTHLITDCPYC